MDVYGAFCEGRVNPANLGFDTVQVAFQAIEILLVHLGRIGLPDFHLGQEAVFPLIGQGDKCGVPPDLLGEFVVTNEATVFAVLLLVFVRTAVIMKSETALLDVALGRDAVPTGAACCEVKEQEAFFVAMLAGPADRHKGLLNVIESRF